ncbi:hypothetical protein Q2T41_09130 [Maribacter confluentis]|uniref:Uncharacterized protein n=2 Tax=Maribacter TaxID=252356 RepID=A0ABY1SIW1_9FLAO|nr:MULTISPECIES: hypothetical protein [Maribacter]MDO1512815.1 hypothetical protein [Maribacter confluentis]TVZ16063.1 hypothetical protein JM81_2316 [Maribacter sp. MAR_2009_72]SNR59790.1 hypothetical protein SAMN04488009_2730 [Maribacter sedimenticola]
MTRVNIDESKKVTALEKAIKFTIVIAAIGIILCFVFLALDK